MDTFSALNNQKAYVSTETKPHSNTAGWSVLALSLLLSSNQMPKPLSNKTDSISIAARTDGSFITEGVYSNRVGYNYSERYKIITESEWFQKAYKNKSLGEIIGVDI
jgi:hypothetical protein